MSRFTEAGAAAMARNINMNNLLSSWVYLDDKDTSQNVIYVSTCLILIKLSLINSSSSD